MNCPNCHSEQAEGSGACSSCLIVFAKWGAKPKEVPVAAAPEEEPSGWGLFPFLAAGGALAWAWMAFWPISPQAAKAPEPGTAVITYRNAKKCLVSSPTFRYSEGGGGGGGWRYFKIGGGQTFAGQHPTAPAPGVRFDKNLRVIYDGVGVDLPMSDIDQIRFLGAVDPAQKDRFAFSRAEIKTRSGKIHEILLSEGGGLFAPGLSFVGQLTGCQRNELPLGNKDILLEDAPLRVEFQ